MSFTKIPHIAVAIGLFGSSAFAQEAPKVVETITLKPETITQRVKLIGVIKAKRESHITAQVDGVVEKIWAAEGAEVKAGKPLAQLRNDEMKGASGEAQSNVKTAKAQYDRIMQLYKDNDVSKQALEEAKTKWSTAKIAAAEARRGFNKTVFTAPFDGVCGVFRVSEGAYVNPGDEIVAFYDPSGLMVEFSVPEKLVPKVKVGKTVLVKNELAPVLSSQQAIDPTTHMGLARAALKKCADCVIGSHIDVEVATDERLGALGLPSEAVFLKDSARHVYVVKNNKAVLTRVEIGLNTGKVLEITKGLKAGDVVVKLGQNKLKNGSPVKVAP
jgi:membrane fusion protein (multidrug efflux system)